MFFENVCMFIQKFSSNFHLNLLKFLKIIDCMLSK